MGIFLTWIKENVNRKENIMEKNTLRLIYPQWQGGMNPDYAFGSELLAVIAPSSKADKTVTINVERNFDEKQKRICGVDAGASLLVQMRETERVLAEEAPDKIIVFGGDCSVSQVPFDYLGGKYKEKIGIIWLDAHPDVSGINVSAHLHEMVLGNLLGQNSDSEITQVRNPYAPDKVLMAGLIEEDIREMDRAFHNLRLKAVSPEALKTDSSLVLKWIKETGISCVAVHWDLDVLSPEDFRCIYPAEPYLNPGSFTAAVGRMTLKDAGRLFQDISGVAEIVGLSIAEHLPWDAMNLRKMLSEISIFKS